MPNSDTIMIQARGLEKHFGETHALRGIDLDVPEGRILAVLGPNGAGKTTLLRALAGETTLQGGELALQKGTRVALHDQRPPLQRTSLARLLCVPQWRMRPEQVGPVRSSATLTRPRRPRSARRP